MKATKPQFDVSNPFIRVRVKNPSLKPRVLRLAVKLERDPADVVREGITAHCDAEEARLGLPPVVMVEGSAK